MEGRENNVWSETAGIGDKATKEDKELLIVGSAEEREEKITGASVEGRRNNTTEASEGGKEINKGKEKRKKKNLSNQIFTVTKYQQLTAIHLDIHFLLHPITTVVF